MPGELDIHTPYLRMRPARWVQIRLLKISSALIHFLHFRCQIQIEPLRSSSFQCRIIPSHRITNHIKSNPKFPILSISIPKTKKISNIPSTGALAVPIALISLILFSHHNLPSGQLTCGAGYTTQTRESSWSELGEEISRGTTVFAGWRLSLGVDDGRNR